MIVFEDVWYSYGGARDGAKALNRITEVIASGEIVGIAGANGAGKTTLLSLLLGFIRPSGGSIRIAGLDPRAFVEREGIGYVAELVTMPRWWTVQSALQRFACLEKLERNGAELGHALEQYDLARLRGDRLSVLSKGSQQRVSLAQAVLTQHRVVVFDEPTHGLDPEWTLNFRELVIALRATDRAIIICSHNLDELERLADRVIIIDRGEVQRTVNMREERGRGGRTYRMIMHGADLTFMQTLFPGVRETGANEFQFIASGPQAVTVGVRALLAAGAELSEVAPAEAGLAQHFAEVIQRRK